MQANRIALRNACRILGLAVCILPLLISILLYFPLWKSAGADKVLSGGAILLIAMAHAPLLKLAREKLRGAASYTVWLLIFIAFLLLSSIAHEMKVISFVGFVSNLAGAVILKLADRIGAESDE